MATYTRNNAWSNGGTFDNTDLLWYAKGVGAMQARPERPSKLVVLRRDPWRVREYYGLLDADEEI